MSVKIRPEVGDMVKIVSGPFCGFNAVIKWEETQSDVCFFNLGFLNDVNSSFTATESEVESISGKNVYKQL